jgi:hypothetical protein
MTGNDLAILRFAAEHEGVLSRQIAVLVRSSEPDAAERLKRLDAQGLTRHHRTHHEQAGYHQITTRGLDAIGSSLPEPRAETITDHRTQLSLPWLTLLAVGGRFGPINRAITERVMRHHDANVLGGANPADPLDPEAKGQHLYGIPLINSLDQDVPNHYPHLVVVAATNHRVAFQIQSRTPAPQRLRAEILAYATDQRIDVAVYLVERVEVGEAIQATLTDLGVSESIRVQRVTLDATVTTSAQ